MYEDESIDKDGNNTEGNFSEKKYCEFADNIIMATIFLEINVNTCIKMNLLINMNLLSKMGVIYKGNSAYILESKFLDLLCRAYSNNIRWITVLMEITIYVCKKMNDRTK